MTLINYIIGMPQLQINVKNGSKRAKTEEKCQAYANK